MFLMVLGVGGTAGYEELRSAVGECPGKRDGGVVFVCFVLEGRGGRDTKTTVVYRCCLHRSCWLIPVCWDTWVG